MKKDLSVILIARRDSKALRFVLRRLRKQGNPETLEVLLTVPGGTPLTDDTRLLVGELQGRVIVLPRFESEGMAKAAGVKEAAAPLVAFLEDHSYPGRGWADALLAAHRQGTYAVVGPAILNGNPESASSWGCFLVFYGSWLKHALPGESRHLPSNHSCYRRTLLLEYGERLPGMLEAESVLHWDLRERGYRLHQEPQARVYHVNHTEIRAMTHEYFLASRVFAASRAHGWGAMRRGGYAAGSPLIPLLRLKRIAGDVIAVGLGAGLLIRVLPTLALTLTAGAVGEFLGYAMGEGRAGEALSSWDNSRYVSLPPKGEHVR